MVYSSHTCAAVMTYSRVWNKRRTGNKRKVLTYSHLSNKREGWNKRGGGAKVAKSKNIEVGINVEVIFFFWKKLLYNCNKRGVEGGKNMKIMLRVDFFSQISKHGFAFIREMRVKFFTSGQSRRCPWSRHCIVYCSIFFFFFFF